VRKAGPDGVRNARTVPLSRRRCQHATAFAARHKPRYGTRYRDAASHADGTSAHGSAHIPFVHHACDRHRSSAQAMNRHGTSADANRGTACRRQAHFTRCRARYAARPLRPSRYSFDFQPIFAHFSSSFQRRPPPRCHVVCAVHRHHRPIRSHSPSVSLHPGGHAPRAVPPLFHITIR